MQPTTSWYDVPQDTKQLLKSAVTTWENTAESMQYMNQVLQQEDISLDVLITAYRYFFYKNDNARALEIANRVVTRIKMQEQFPEDWDQLKQVLMQRKEDSIVRLFLNAYSASGFVLARLGQAEQAKAIAARVKELDDRNEFGADVVWNILTREPDEDN